MRLSARTILPYYEADFVICAKILDIGHVMKEKKSNEEGQAPGTLRADFLVKTRIVS